MKKQSIHAIFSRLQQATPYPTTELIYHSNFELLIAVILSARTTDRIVNKATKPLFAVANTPETILQLGESGLRPYFKTIGLYLNKTKYIIQTSKIIKEQWQSQVPNDRKALEALPGVGRKTANVILNTCFLQPTIAVDTHIFRVANRIGLVRAKTPLAVEKALLACVPDEFKLNAHHWLLLHGRYVCLARKPRCPACLLQDLCCYPYKTQAVDE